MNQPERRQHRRLNIRLPLECCPVGGDLGSVRRTVTSNISTGGLYFETDATDLRAGQDLQMELTVPPGDGYFPYYGRVTGVGKVVRVSPLSVDGGGQTGARAGVAAQFSENLKLSF